MINEMNLLCVCVCVPYLCHSRICLFSHIFVMGESRNWKCAELVRNILFRFSCLDCDLMRKIWIVYGCLDGLIE